MKPNESSSSKLSNPFIETTGPGKPVHPSHVKC